VGATFDRHLNGSAHGLVRAFVSGLVLVTTLSVLSTKSFAADSIEFPDDELASESVLPVFDRSESVKNRAVRSAGRFEFGPTGSYSLLEPLFNPMSFGATATYHFSETNGINFFGTYFMKGLSDNGNNLNPVPGRTGSPSELNFNAQYAPAPKYLGLVNYQFTPFYGKISLTKDYIMNLALYGFVGGGMMGVGDSAAPVGNFGIGQKLYFSRNFALRMDLRFLGYSGPDVVSRNLAAEKAEVSAEKFEKKLIFSSLVSVGAVFLL
jgi:outer membrane beta-barrel protein